MDSTGILLVWVVNLATGLGLLALGAAMARRPDRVWVGVRVLHNPDEVARVRRANIKIAPWILVLGLVELLSGPAALIINISPLGLAVGGLSALLLAISALAAGAVLSR